MHIKLLEIKYDSNSSNFNSFIADDDIPTYKSVIRYGWGKLTSCNLRGCAVLE